MRVLVGRCVAALTRRLAGSDVYSYPIARAGQGWTYVEHRKAARVRRAKGRELLAVDACVGVGTMDVASYYGSVDIDTLATQLVRAPTRALDALVRMLTALPVLGGVKGLPIGFEGSGILGNAYLLPADSVFDSRRVGFVRWTDDSWLFLRDEVDWEPALAEYRDRLAELHLVVNEAKCGFHSKGGGFPEDVVANSTIDSITASAVGPVDPDEARELLLWELDVDDDLRDDTVISFAMSCLRSSMPGDVPELVMEHPELWRLAPKATGDLLVGAANDSVVRRKIDPEWLAASASAEDGDRGALAGRLHAARVASQLHLGRKVGATFYGLATSNDMSHVPLRAMAAKAWASSEHWNPSRAVDAALDAGHLTLRRSFVGGFKHRADHKKKAAHWKRLHREDPDLSPTLGWAEA